MTDTQHFHFGELSDREKQILALTASGLIDKMIAAKLDISIHTVRAYWDRIKNKAGNLPRTALVAAYVRESAELEHLQAQIPKDLAEVPTSRGEDAWRQTALYYATALAQLQDSIRMADRAASVLTAYPKLSLQAETEEEICHAACRILVQEGGYAMAWVGVAQHDPEKLIKVGSSYGDAHGYLEGLRVSWGPGPLGEGPAGMAIRTGETQVNRDFLVNPNIAPWRDKALLCGFQSSIGMPLKASSGIVGVLSAYAREPDAFDRAETRLLEVIAQDLGGRLHTSLRSKS